MTGVQTCALPIFLIDGKIFMADSRQRYTHESGVMQYEWYYLNGIGSFSNDTRVYRYSQDAPSDDFTPHPNPDMPADGEIISTVKDSETIYYTTDGEIKYPVYPTEEFRGGDMSPLTILHSVADRLYFATQNGDLLLFNSDLCGVAPEFISSAEEFNSEAYDNEYGNRLHPYYYSFDRHAPLYALKTAKDNGGIPHMLKDTVKNSLVLKCRALCSGKIICEIGTDDKGYREICAFPGRDIFFGDMDFSMLTLVTSDVYTVPIRIKSKRWVEQQISIYTNEYASPFGISAIAYRFKIAGKIKEGR